MKISLIIKPSALVEPIRCLLIVGCSLFFAGLTTTYASVVVLTGGDAGEGFDPLGAVAAVDLTTNTDLFSYPITVQNVPFASSSPMISWGGGLLGSSIIDIGSSTNDNNLENVIRSIRWGSTINIDVTGLNPGQIYQFDLFVSLGGLGIRRMEVDYRDSSNNLLGGDAPWVLDPNTSYNVVNSFAAPSDGFIRIRALGAPDGTYTDPNAVVSALSISTIPEPSSLILTVLGFAGCLAWRQKRTNPWLVRLK